MVTSGDKEVVRSGSWSQSMTKEVTTSGSGHVMTKKTLIWVLICKEKRMKNRGKSDFCHTARDTPTCHPLKQLRGDSSYWHIVTHHQVTLLNMSTCTAAPEAFVFPAASAIANNPLNVGDRAEKMNLFDCSNTMCMMKGMSWADQGPTPPDLSSCSLLHWRREIERSWYMPKQNSHSTHHEWQNDKVSGGLQFSWFTHTYSFYM